jgi:GGDEF domain-containing protein
MDCFRGYDIVGRGGDEEFAVCMPNTTTENAMIACERFKRTLKGVSCSIGAMTLFDLVKNLDIAINENTRPDTNLCLTLLH